MAAEIPPLTAPFTLSEHFGADGQLIRRVGMLLPPYPMRWTPTMNFLQPRIEEIVRERVGHLSSVDVGLGMELKGLRQDTAGVELDLRSIDDEATSLRARYVLGCYGASSTVRALLGVEVEDLDFDEP